MAKHRYTFEHRGVTYTRQTARTYTHAAVLYMDTHYRAPCEPYVADVCYSSSLAGALKAKKAWHSHIEIVPLTQPA